MLNYAGNAGDAGEYPPGITRVGYYQQPSRYTGTSIASTWQAVGVIMAKRGC